MDRESGKHLAGGTPKNNKPQKPKKPSRLTRQQKLLIAVAAVLAVILIAVVACQSLFVRPELPGKDPDRNRTPRKRRSTGARASAPTAAGSGRATTTTRS